MKNVFSLKSSNTNSPKTPGGISKSLLTPCRRVGLSRNWRKSGPSPFISPLSGNTEVKEEKIETRKRKQRVPDENIEESPTTSFVDKQDEGDEGNTEVSDNVDKTPPRSVELPRRKRSKTLVSAINKVQEDVPETIEKEQTSAIPVVVDVCDTENVEVVSTPVRTKSKKSKKRNSPIKSSHKEVKCDVDEAFVNSSITPSVNKKKEEEAIYTIKEKSPNDLKKECIVVIQRKIFKNVENNTTNEITQTKEEKKPPETDSDSDETPLINLHKQNSVKSSTKAIIADDDDDFIENKSKIKPIKKDTKSPKTKSKNSKLSKTKVEKIVTESKPSSQDCFDDDDDDFDNKKTILIRKTYEKVAKPMKAKSTGSITQKDIDALKERIEAKKKLLLAQSLTPDTEELRTLIKKWQKGCQEALMELLDLMKTKFPDKERMDYSEMLKTLKIPPSLVGYDSENDCFNSPDDASIILGQFKDI
ncbi:uncharacterized protein LOC142983451 [Anticarsia gemmatalis]|uniref:uncharacterized protein LOC142983451 n=1 Tax=Anticarsia gemmatalis TaxID=129554 RepID=UPI003F76C6B7